MQLLERRLDNVIYRLRWAHTRPQARQFVTHGHVLVDGKSVNTPSYLVNPQQHIALKIKSQARHGISAMLETHTHTAQ